MSGERSVTDKECEQRRVSISAILGKEFEGGGLIVNLPPHQETWKFQPYAQKSKFRLPLEGQVLVLNGHRIGEPHRSAQISSQHFGWDLLPLHNDGLRLIKRSLAENLEAEDFEGFGQAVLAPASGHVVRGR